MVSSFSVGAGSLNIGRRSESSIFVFPFFVPRTALAGMKMANYNLPSLSQFCRPRRLLFFCEKMSKSWEAFGNCESPEPDGFTSSICQRAREIRQTKNLSESLHQLAALIKLISQKCLLIRVKIHHPRNCGLPLPLGIDFQKARRSWGFLFFNSPLLPDRMMD